MKRNTIEDNKTIVETMIDNAVDMIKDLKETNPEISKFGISKVMKGDPIYMEQADMPIICISLLKIGNEEEGIGHQSRSDVIYLVQVKILASAKLSNFNESSFWSVSSAVYEYVTLNSEHIFTNIYDNEKKMTGLPITFDDLNFGYDRKVVGGETAFVRSAEFTFSVQRHRQKKNIRRAW